MSRFQAVFRFLILGTLVFLVIGKESAREIIPIPSQELVKAKESWELANRTKAGPAVLKYIVDDIIYKEILCREALNLHFHQTDRVVWNRLIQNMRFAQPDTTMDDEELFIQALSLDMHLTDLIVKRRLVARMEHFIKNNHYIDEPDDAEIDRFIRQNPDLFKKGEKISFGHVFLSSEGKNNKDPEAYGKQLLRKLRKENLAPKEAYKLGNMFPHPYIFKNTGSAYIQNLFGGSFIPDILTCKIGTWSGPFKSGYGLHLVRLEDKSVTKVTDLPENRNRARNHIAVEREKQLISDIVAELNHTYYTILIDGVPAEDFRLEQLLDTQVVP